MNKANYFANDSRVVLKPQTGGLQPSDLLPPTRNSPRSRFCPHTSSPHALAPPRWNDLTESLIPEAGTGNSHWTDSKVRLTGVKCQNHRS